MTQLIKTEYPSETDGNLGGADAIGTNYSGTNFSYVDKLET